MPSTIEVTFEFEIGELVFVKGSQHTSSHRPVQQCIAERFAQQYHGGIQQMYKFATDGTLYPEVALTRDEPEYRPASPAYLKDYVATKAAEREALDIHWQRKPATKGSD